MTLEPEPGVESKRGVGLGTPKQEGDSAALHQGGGTRPGAVLLSGGPCLFARREEKYELDPKAAEQLKDRIARWLPVFCYYDGQPNTLITTVYFDTKNRDFYLRAERDYDHNVKIRVREYYYPNGSSPPRTVFPRTGGLPTYIVQDHCFVELKQRRHGTVIKKRFAIPKCELRGLFSGEDVWPALLKSNPPGEVGALREAYTEFRRYLTHYAVEVTSIVNYRRTVYQRDENDLRITLDDKLAVYPPVQALYSTTDALVAESLGKPIRTSDRVILEIKCPGEYPFWLRDTLSAYSAERLSKFTTSVRLILGSSTVLGPAQVSRETGPQS